MTQKREDWTDPAIRFGTAAEWTAFGARNARFLERFARLREALSAVCIRTLSKVEKELAVLCEIPRRQSLQLIAELRIRETRAPRLVVAPVYQCRGPVLDAIDGTGRWAARTSG